MFEDLHKNGMDGSNFVFSILKICICLSEKSLGRNKIPLTRNFQACGLYA